MERGCLFQQLWFCPDGWTADEVPSKGAWVCEQHMQGKQTTEGVPGKHRSMRIDRIAVLDQRAQFLQKKLLKLRALAGTGS